MADAEVRRLRKPAEEVALLLWRPSRDLCALCVRMSDVDADHTMFSCTSMLLRVAFEYGQTLCASCTSFCACSRSSPGSLIVMRTATPKPSEVGPRSTSASMAASAGTCT